MDEATKRAAREYQEAMLSVAQYQEAVRIANQTAHQAREALTALDPKHGLLQLSPNEMMETVNGLGVMNPLQGLVELFMKPQQGPGPRDLQGASPSTAMLAGSLAVTQTGPLKTTDILRRVFSLTRSLTDLQR